MDADEMKNVRSSYEIFIKWGILKCYHYDCSDLKERLNPLCDAWALQIFGF